MPVSAVICALLLAGQTKEPTAVVPLVMVGRSPAIHVLVDGHDAIVELDTGSFELRLSSEFAEKNQILGSRVRLKIGEGAEMSLKPVVEDLAGPQPELMATTYVPHSDGILGLDVLRHFALGIDTIDGKVAFWRGGKLGANSARAWEGIGPSASIIDLHTDGADDWYRVDARVNDRPLNLLLDTGTAYSTVNPSLVGPLMLKVVGSTPVQEIGHFETLKVAVADSISFGPLQADFPVLNVESEDDTHVDGILGTESLGSGKFVIDMPGLALYAAQMKATMGNPLERRMHLAGLEVFPSVGSSLLAIVRPGGLAAQKGVRSGDQLIAIGNVTMDDMFGNLHGKMDASRLERMVGVAFRAMKGDLSLKIRKSGDGAVVELPLPEN